MHCCKPWDSTGVVLQGTGADDPRSSVVLFLLALPWRAEGPGAFGGRRSVGRSGRPAVGPREDWRPVRGPWWGLRWWAVGGAPSTLRHGRHGCTSRGGSRREGREAGAEGGPRGGRRGGGRLLCCEMFLKVPPELLDPSGGPGGEHKECALPVLQRAELESRAQSRPVLWGPEAGPELSPVGNTWLVKE